MRKKSAGRNDQPEAHPLATLPFVSPIPGGKPHCWTVPPVGGPVADYNEAGRIGREYAQQFVQWLQANPSVAGMGILGWIASDIDYQVPDHSGYWVGFFSCIECLLVDRVTGNGN